MNLNHMKNAVLEINNVSKVFQIKSQYIVVLKQINLQINQGEFAIIFGPSGCGKSTLLHTMLGLEKPTSGTVHFMNKNFYDYNEDERSEMRKTYMGMIYQQPNWIRSLTVIENVAFVGSLLGYDYDKATQKAKKMLEMVGMEDWADYKPTELSSGQQQRVALARGLITDPQVIIADEPTGNLDYQSGLELMNLFKDLQTQGKTIIMVTHNIDNIDYSTKVVHIFDGQILKIIDISKDNVEKIKNDLTLKLTRNLDQNESQKSEYIKAFTSSINKKDYSKQNKFTLFKKSFGIFFQNVVHTLQFISLLFIYLLEKLVLKIEKIKFVPSFISKGLLPKSKSFFDKATSLMDKSDEKTISKSDLIDLSLKNMLSKKSRSIITIGGMALGIGAIVFLVSLGFGLERLVISRVARLDEMKQIDASPAIGSNVKLNDKSLSTFQQIKNVAKVLPVIGLVSKITYNNSNTDVVVYGVVSDYLKESAIKPSTGTVFADNSIIKKVSQANINDTDSPRVLGASTENVSAHYNEKISLTEYTVDPDIFIRVRTQPNTAGQIIGYTKRTEENHTAQGIWGSTYLSEDESGKAGTDPNGKPLGKWLQDKVRLWQQKKCTQEDNGCEKGSFVPLLDTHGVQVQESGYFAFLGVTIKNDTPRNGAVLGLSTDISSTGEKVSQTSTDEADIQVAQLLNTAKPQDSKKITLPPSDKRQIVVNSALLKVLNLKENEALKKKINLTFISTGDVTSDGEKIESYPTEYEIIGVVRDEKTPIVYVPLMQLKELGITSYSQMKLVVNNQIDVAKVRKQVEVLGYRTTSVVDTVSQIEKLFGTVRLLLGLLGVVALAVAALGMFNTLTVSLLERTHEVGMMKAIGMKSTEIQDLFLTESMIMGLFGGIGGLAMGFAGGKLLSILLSVAAIYKHIGLLDISYIPFNFTVLILVLSIIVGITTGLYPSYRAKKISALNALRYE